MPTNSSSSVPSPPLPQSWYLNNRFGSLDRENFKCVTAMLVALSLKYLQVNPMECEPGKYAKVKKLHQKPQ